MRAEDGREGRGSIACGSAGEAMLATRVPIVWADGDGVLVVGGRGSRGNVSRRGGDDAETDCQRLRGVVR